MVKSIVSRIVVILVMTGCLASLLQCSDSEIPPFPSRIQIVSGDNQFTKHGTQLPEPLVIKVSTSDGTAAEDIAVVFQVLTGGGTVSRAGTSTNSGGLASTRWTVGTPLGSNTLRAYIDGMSDKSVTFDATSSYAYCPEGETTLTVSYGPAGNLIFGSSESNVFSDHAGLAKLEPAIGGDVSAFVGFPTGIFTTAIWDVAFSPRGDLYIAATELFDYVIHVAADGTTSEFAPLGDFYGSFPAAEITTYADGLLAGCNNKGPFIVTCGDSLLRFDGVGAVYNGVINNDAVAADPVTDDIYYIHNAQHNLLRLPIDTLTATGPPEVLTGLTVDEATGARGMVCGQDRMIYILVDTDDTKKIMRVSAIDGSTALVFDFFTRGGGTADDAGILRDLALDSNSDYLYTIDTLNNQLLRYQLPGGPLTARLQGGSISTSIEGGERVCLDVMR